MLCEEQHTPDQVETNNKRKRRDESKETLTGSWAFTTITRVNRSYMSSEEKAAPGLYKYGDPYWAFLFWR